MPVPRLTEVFLVNEDDKSKFRDPEYYGLPESCRETLTKFLDNHQKKVNHGPNKAEDTEGDYCLFVDDFEEVGLREAIEQNDLATAEKVAAIIMKKYPPSRYNAFSSHDTEPGDKN